MILEVVRTTYYLKAVTEVYGNLITGEGPLSIIRTHSDPMKTITIFVFTDISCPYIDANIQAKTCGCDSTVSQMSLDINAVAPEPSLLTRTQSMGVDGDCDQDRPPV